MCGILGAVFNKKTKENMNLIKLMIKELSNRGTHCFGVSYFKDNALITKKMLNLNMDELLNDFETSNSDKIIFHNRYSTSGDWKNMENNQPLTFGNTSIVMNGVIHMGTKIELEKEFDEILTTENDTETVLLKFVRGDSIETFLKNNTSCSLAAIFLTTKINYIRNNKRPLYLFKHPDYKIVVSTLTALKAAQVNIQDATIVSPFQMMEL